MTVPPPLGGAPDGAAAARAHRILAFALLSAPLYILVALVFAAPPAEEDLPTWVAAAAIALVAAGWLLAQTIGYRVAPLTSTDGPAVAVQRFQQSALLRFVLTEVPIIIGIASVFVLPYGIWSFVVALVVGLPAMALHVWPSRRVVDKVATALESGGVPSALRETFGHR
ncbi:hypothetical protein [Aeromicrobium sp. Leaf350]|uniref:hypothetical protein n=1 Tax=Aeromicrobium sp. Leaf350 TaxID=2876565 RepID=UPI001E641D2E|nr:hypothetical protein [Aeromicrobium sp. Leaf350]